MPLSRNEAISSVVVIVPTSNAARFLPNLSEGILRQGLCPDQVVIIDSTSQDGTPELAVQMGFKLLSVHRKDFNHGGTRQAALAAAQQARIAVYMTQDAALASSDAIYNLISPFEDDNVGATYGRQLPRTGAGPIEAHARVFNYPSESKVHTWESRDALGLRTAFLSNSFAAYRIRALEEVGGFPSDVIMAEDTIVAARMLMAGWKTVYVADASVFHSHSYSIGEEFRRYFDTGVYHNNQSWILENFGSARGEGLQFVLSEIRYLLPQHAYLIPLSLLRTGAKLLGYNLGRNASKYPLKVNRFLSMHRSFWQSKNI